jgi:hypothetical protein
MFIYRFQVEQSFAAMCKGLPPTTVMLLSMPVARLLLRFSGIVLNSIGPKIEARAQANS